MIMIINKFVFLIQSKALLHSKDAFRRDSDEGQCSQFDELFSSWLFVFNKKRKSYCCKNNFVDGGQCQWLHHIL